MLLAGGLCWWTGGGGGAAACLQSQMFQRLWPYAGMHLHLLAIWFC